MKQKNNNGSKCYKVAFYMRVSKEEQTIENQMIQLDHLKALEGWTDVTVFTDEGISGEKGREHRPGIDDLLWKAERGHFDVVAAWSIDRLGRDFHELQQINKLAQDKDNGFTLYFHLDRCDTSTASGELYFNIMASVAKFWNRRTSENVKAGQERARAQGKIIGRPKAEEARDKNGHPRHLNLVGDVLKEREKGTGIKKIATTFKIGVGAVYRILKENQAS